MITNLHIGNFKSWQDTGQIKMSALTGFFGTNSSGKTTILQLLLLLKQTVEAVDRQRVLNTADERGYVNLGTFYDFVHKHQVPGQIRFLIDWELPQKLDILNPDTKKDELLFCLDKLTFVAAIDGGIDFLDAYKFYYFFQDINQKSYRFGMKLQDIQERDTDDYELIAEGYKIKRNKGRVWPLPAPVKCYGFPDQVNAYYQNAGFLSELVLEFEQLFQRIYYLGPLREYPYRLYTWAGDRPQDVGRRGESTVAALLADRKLNKGKKLEEKVAQCLKDLGLIYEFKIEPIAPNRQDYEVRVRRSPEATEVLITDVGFGVSQILPVLVLCYYVPEGSTIILEQPEIHLHPSVQAGLADVFIDAIKTRKVQIILESHSEHLLRRLQRRVAEEELSNEDAALYFCEMNHEGVSQLTPLQLDEFGNINNWPTGFFGDEMGELIAMTEAAMKRKMQEPK